VVTGGMVRAGDPVVVVSRPEHDVTVPEVFRAFMGDLNAAHRVLAADCLVEAEAAGLRDVVARRGKGGVELDDCAGHPADHRGPG
jgi:MOSC domain-containing protein YiiM